MPPTNTPAPAPKASPESLGEAERRDAQAEFREWLESKAPDHEWPQPITAIVAHAAEFFAPATDRREPGEGSEPIVVDGRECHIIDFGGHWRILDKPFQHGGQWLWGDGKWRVSLECADSQTTPAKWPTEAAARAFAASKST